MPSRPDFCFMFAFPWFRRKEGKVFSDLCMARASLEFDVDEVSFSALGLPPDLRAIKNLFLISGVLEPFLPVLLV